ncbi:Il31ra [Columba guinea]|nr:Il31ra [Columba guinea]
MFICLIWMFVLLCSSIADENSIRDVDIFPSSPEIERGSTLKLFCVLGKRYTPHRNASQIIWKLNHELIAQENYNIVNETVSSVTIHNFTYSKAHVKCFTKYLGNEQLLVHTEVKSGFPPGIPRNISCIYYFDVELTCTWSSGRETNLKTNYTLYRKMMTEGRVTLLNTMGSCQSKTESCSFYYPDTPYSSSFCFQVKAENVLGEALSDCVPIPLEKIEKFQPPEILSVKKITGIKQLLTLTWEMPEKIIPAQDVTCQVHYKNLYSNSSEFVTVSLNSAEKTGSCNLTGLWDSTEYSVAIRCISDVSIFWSEWSRVKTASTEEKDCKIQIRKERLVSDSVYVNPVKYNLLNPHLSVFIVTLLTCFILQYFEYMHVNIAFQKIEAVRTFTTNEEVVVEWITSKPEVTEYVVEWYQELETDPFEPSEGPVADTGIPGKNEIIIKWKEISKDKRNGFISNYTIFYKPEDGKELNETVNSDVLQYRLKSLQANTQYTVYIMASNEAGGTSGEPKTFKTLKFSMIIGEKKILYEEENEVPKCISPSMSYIITDQDIRSQMHLALIPAKAIQPRGTLGDDVCESQQTSIKNEENYNEEVLKLEDFSENAVFNPYLKNSVKTREFLISENLPEHRKNERNSQSAVSPPLQNNVAGQSYLTLDMFRLATTH